MEIHHSELLFTSWLRRLLRDTLVVSCLVVDAGLGTMCPAIPTRRISLYNRSRAILRKLETSLAVSFSYESFVPFNRLISIS